MTIQNDSANDTGQGVDEPTEESQNAIANADNDTAQESAPEDGTDTEGSTAEEIHQVPLNTFISERQKRQEYQKELEALRATREQEIAQLEAWENARGEIEETYRKEQELAQKQARLEAEVAQYRALAEENGLEVDMSASENQLLMQKLSQTVTSMPDEIRRQMDAWQREQAQKAEESARQAQEAQARREAAEQFDREFDELTKAYPAMQVQKDTFRSLHEASGGSQSAKDILSPILGTVTGIEKAKEAKAKLPNTQTGTGNDTPSGNARGFLPGETISEWSARQKALINQ